MKSQQSFSLSTAHPPCCKYSCSTLQQHRSALTTGSITGSSCGSGLIASGCIFFLNERTRTNVRHKVEVKLEQHLHDASFSFRPFWTLTMYRKKNVHNADKRHISQRPLFTSPTTDDLECTKIQAMHFAKGKFCSSFSVYTVPFTKDCHYKSLQVVPGTQSDPPHVLPVALWHFHLSKIPAQSHCPRLQWGLRTPLWMRLSHPHRKSE